MATFTTQVIGYSCSIRYDLSFAGTDSGVTVLSPDNATSPFVPITELACGTGVLCEAQKEQVAVTSWHITRIA